MTADQHAKKAEGPWTFKLAKWYGYILAASLLVTGGVDIVLGILDKKYDNFSQNFLLLLIGLIIALIATALKDQKPWAWFGMTGVCSILLIAALVQLSSLVFFDVAVIVLTLITLIALLMPQTRKYASGHR
jgi:hypothetical protein